MIVFLLLCSLKSITKAFASIIKRKKIILSIILFSDLAKAHHFTLFILTFIDVGLFHICLALYDFYITALTIIAQLQN